MQEDIPQYALSIMQPWAWLIVNGHKDIENRDWPTKFRGPVAIHAGKKVDTDTECWLAQGIHPVSGHLLSAKDGMMNYPYPVEERGGIVGVAEIVDCIASSDSGWFVGKHGFVIRNARPIEFIPVRGSLGFFSWRNNLVGAAT
ncbi:ASCH domain-containing protein [Rhizobium rhizogenes]|uniref:ASCH domain-containing protein n=1 Tax=Rhizobium rhizogenes TaxID=359 RepID=UPI0015734BB8|nr:ASCH domain-containing protein [Rhizobium rhizogenes]NTF67724.1 ASCH domain-containing protein [Rhizobium rhizogenes]